MHSRWNKQSTPEPDPMRTHLERQNGEKETATLYFESKNMLVCSLFSARPT